MFQTIPNARRQLFHVKWLSDVIVGAGVESAGLIVDRRVSRKHDHGGSAAIRSELSENVNACYIRHIPVENDKIVGRVPQLLHSCAARANCRYIVLFESQPISDRRQNHSVVIYYQNLRHDWMAPSNCAHSSRRSAVARLAFYILYPLNYRP